MTARRLPRFALPLLLLVASASAPVALGDREAMGVAELSDIARDRSPQIGGVCRSCPEVDFGPFTPTAAVQFHGATLAGGGDCAWYQFRVVAGHTYAFNTCPPGSITWEGTLELIDPADCGAILASNADGCGPGSMGSRIVWTATSSGSVHLKLRPLNPATVPGAYTLAYEDQGAICESCAIPGGAIDASGTSCSCVTGRTDATCPSDWYDVVLLAGETYQFTTCPSVCSSATASYDTSLKLHAPNCTLNAVNDDACGGIGSFQTRSTLTVTPALSGRYHLEVTGTTRGGGAPDFGSYSACARRLSCGLFPAVGPGAGVTEATSCSRTQDFAVGVGPLAALPVTYAWTATPVAGGFAIPGRGTVTSSAPNGAATFRTRLTGPGVHRILVVATNSCSSLEVARNYVLSDRSPPFVQAPPGVTVECPNSPPPSSPRVRDNCDASPDVVMTQVTTPGACPNAYSVRRTWIATDDSGNASAPARQVVNVRDTTPPVITPDLTTAHCVFPPDHGRACFTFSDFTPQASDACPGPISWIFARVTHDEAALGACDPPDGSPDVEIAADGTSFCVRAERCNDNPLAGPGRRYLVEARATDACGNSSAITPIATILVPQDSADTSSCRVPVPWD